MPIDLLQPESATAAAPATPPPAAPVDLLANRTTAAPATPPTPAPAPIDLLKADDGPVNLLPLAQQNVQAQRNEATFFGAESRMGGYEPQVHDLSGEIPAAPAKPAPAPYDPAGSIVDIMRMRGAPLAASESPVTPSPPRTSARYVRVSGEDFDSVMGTDRSARGTPVGEAYQSGRVHKEADGNYIVTEGLANAIAAEKANAPQPQQSLAQDLKNVPANIGASVTRGIGGAAGIVGSHIKRLGQINTYPTAPEDQEGRPVDSLGQPIAGEPARAMNAVERAGAGVQRQGNYLAEGAAQTERDLPVQGEIGKLAVGAGTLGVDAAMSTLVGPTGFVASFAGRSAGTMYVQARAQGDDENTAAAKGITAGFTAAVTPQIAHILPPQVGEEIAVQAAKAYLGTGSMVAAQATVDELTLKAGTTLKIDLSNVFPEAATQGLIGVAMHGSHAALAAHQQRAANPEPPPRTAEPAVTRPGTMQTPATEPGDYGNGLATPPAAPVDLLVQPAPASPQAPVDLLKAAPTPQTPQTAQEASAATEAAPTSQSPAEPVKVQEEAAGEPEKTPQAPPETEQPAPTPPTASERTPEPPASTPPAEATPPAAAEAGPVESEQPAPEPVEKPAQPAEQQQDAAGDKLGEDVAVTAHRPESVPAPESPAKAKPRARQPSETERKLLEHFEQHQDEEGQQGRLEDEADSHAGNATLFPRDPRTESGLPRDIADRFTAPEIKEMLRRNIAGIKEGSKWAEGADAFAGMGDKYESLLRGKLDDTRTRRLQRAIDFAREGQDPEMRLLAAEVETRPADDKTPPKAKVKPEQLEIGDKATINKLPVEVIEQDGQKVLKDGDELPETPIDYLEHVPLDRGSLVKAGSKEVKDSFTSAQQADAPTSLMERIGAAETAARERLKTRFANADARARASSQGRRRGGGAADPIFDPDTLKDLVIVGGAKLAKLGIKAAQLGKQAFHLTTDTGRKLYAQWKPLMQADVPGITTEALNKTWLQIRKLGRMSEEEHANWWIDQLGTPAEKGEKVLTRVRRLTGQVDTSKAVSELDALAASMRGQARGADAGYKAGVRDVNGLKSELARIVKENLPPSAQRQFLDDVAKVSTPGQVALAINKGRRLLADHDVRTALSDLEDLTGTLKINVARPPVGRAAADKPARVAGDIRPEDIKRVDLTTLPKDVREQVSSLLEEARYLKDRLRKASALAPEEATGDQTKAGQLAAAKDVSIAQKQRAVEAFQKIDRQVREIVANHLAAEELRVGDKLVSRDKVVKEVVAKLGGAVKDAPRSSEGAEGVRFEGAKKLFGRSALSMDAIATNTVGPDSDAYKLTIHNVRQGQSDYHGEQRKTHEAFEPALEKAGIPAGSTKLDQWLSKPEAVTLPDLGEFKMTRDEMLDVVATASDPQTRKLVDGGVRWTFGRAKREVPIKFSPADLDALRANLTPGELGLLDTFRARNTELTGPAMAAKLNLSGWAPDATPDYYPRSRNRSQSQEAGLPEGWRGHMTRALENVSSMEARAQDTRMPLSVKGFMARVFDHFDDTAKLIHLAEPVRNAAALWQHPDVTRAIAHHFGESMNQRFENFLRDTMMVRSAPPAGTIEKAWGLIARQVARTWLQLNPSPMLKNVLGGTASLLPEFEARDFAAGVAKMFSGKTYSRMMEGSGVAWARFHGGLYGQYTPLAGGKSQTIAEMSFGQALKSFKFGQAVDAIPFMEYADSVPLRAAWAASESYVDRTQPGLKGDERTRAVADKFEQALYRTQNGTSSTEASGFASAARGKPMLAAYLMFKSDTAKKYSLLAMMKHMDGPTRAKTLTAVGVNAALSAAVGYGLKQGANAIGRAIGGTQQDPKDEERIRQATIWNGIKDVAGIVPTGALLTEVANAWATKGQSSIGGNPVQDSVTALINGLVQAGRASEKWGETESGSAEAEKAGNKILPQVWKLVTAGRTLLGDPTLPLSNLVKRGYGAATYQAPDAREEAAKAKAKEATAARESLPPSVKALTAEHQKLQALGRDQLKPVEKSRLAQLDAFERTYQVKIKDLEAARARGDQGAVNQVKRDLHEAAKGVGQIKVDPRMEAVRDKEEQERKLRESLPQPVRDLASEHARLNRLPKDQLTREERIRLYRLGDFADYYQAQLKWIRAARQRGDKAMEDAARQRLEAAAAQVKG